MIGASQLVARWTGKRAARRPGTARARLPGYAAPAADAAPATTMAAPAPTPRRPAAASRTTFPVFVSCLPGLEPLLRAELRAIGATPRDADATTAIASGGPAGLRAAAASKKSFSRNKAARAAAAIGGGGGVAVAPLDVEGVMRLGLWLGCGSHVLMRLATFRCRALGELERKAKGLPWCDWLLPAGVPVKVTRLSIAQGLVRILKRSL